MSLYYRAMKVRAKKDLGFLIEFRQFIVFV
jgi:hypothetical protein